jgi:hypothetical protein
MEQEFIIYDLFVNTGFRETERGFKRVSLRDLTSLFDFSSYGGEYVDESLLGYSAV